MGDFHGDHLDPVLASQFEHIRQAVLAVALERIGAGAWLVGTHACTHLAVFLQGFHHGLDVFRRVDGAQAGEYMQGILSKAYTVVVEPGRAPVILVATQHPVFFRDPHHALDAGQVLHLFECQCGRITDQVDLGE